MPGVLVVPRLVLCSLPLVALACTGPNPAYLRLSTDGPRDGGPGPSDAQNDAPGSDAQAVVDASISGLIGYWPFDEGSGNRVADLSGLANHGSIVGPIDLLTAWKPGKVGQGLDIPDQVGNAVSVSPSPSVQSITSAFTISAWVYRKTDLANRNAVVISRQYGTGNGELYTLAVMNNSLVLWMHATSSVSFLGNRTAPLDTWFHVAATWDGSMIRLYQDGDPVGTGSYSTPLPATTNPLLLGNNANQVGINQPLAGILDEVRLYDRALSDADIRLLATGGAP